MLIQTGAANFHVNVGKSPSKGKAGQDPADLFPSPALSEANPRVFPRFHPNPNSLSWEPGRQF